jgi:hypothetical protein
MLPQPLLPPFRSRPPSPPCCACKGSISRTCRTYPRCCQCLETPSHFSGVVARICADHAQRYPNLSFLPSDPAPTVYERGLYGTCRTYPRCCQCLDTPSHFSGVIARICADHAQRYPNLSFLPSDPAPTVYERVYM